MIKTTLLILLLATSLAPARPNVILVMTDDQGYGDLSCHGNPDLKTPNLDRLHADSVRLTNFHVDPTCAPTRSALLTGRYSLRAGVWHTIAGRSLLPRNEVTIADVFRANGYRTGMFGKWHLGDNSGYRPPDRGFDTSIHHGGGGVGQTPDLWGNDYFNDRYWKDGVPTQFKGYCTDVFFEGALDFITEKSDQPFFCYLTPNAPHGPYYVPEADMKPYLEQGIPESRARFYGMVANIDDNMGRLMKMLKKKKLENDTVLIFMTDNGTAGPWFPKEGEDFSAGLRGIKGSIYEGGHRVPFFVRWPKGGLKGGVDRDQLAAHIDVLPTLMDWCKLDRAGPDMDGKSLAPMISGDTVDWPDRTLVVNNQRVAMPVKWRNATVMTQQWRLVNKDELYDMSVDRAQTNNVAKVHKDIVVKLRTAYERWWASASEREGAITPILLGLNKEPELLTAHDWHADKVPWDQSVVKQNPKLNGHWEVDVLEEGTYDFELYQYAPEANKPIEGETAHISLGTASRQIRISRGGTGVAERLRLPAGRAQLRAWFKLKDGSSRGAFYVRVTRR